MGFSSQGLLRGCATKEVIDTARVERATVVLVSLNYTFISLRGSETMRYLDESKFTRTTTVTKLMRQLGANGYDDDMSARILGTVLGHIWFNVGPEEPPRSEWTALCLDSLNAARVRVTALVHMAAGAGASLIFFPESYCALLHFLSRSPKLKPEERKLIRDTRRELLDLIGAAAIKAFANNPRMLIWWSHFVAGMRERARIIPSAR